MVILGRFLTLFFLWPLFLGLQDSRFTLFLILNWWVLLLFFLAKGIAAI